MTNDKTLKRALELAHEGVEIHSSNSPEYKVCAALIALAQQSNEQDTCKGCNGNGVVGNILDTVPCPFCKCSGIESQQSNEQVEEPSAYQNIDLPNEVVSLEDWEDIDPIWHMMYRPLFAHPPVPTAQPEQEPVAWITEGGKGWLRWHNKNDDHLNKTSIPLYKHPKREPLSDAEIALISAECSLRTPSDIYFARAIEAAHGIEE